MVGYRAGDGMYAQVVNDLGLVLGEDVDAARSDLFDRPADSASRAAWLEYVLAQDPTLSRDDADDMTRADLIARVTTPEPARVLKKAAAKTEKTPEPDV